MPYIKTTTNKTVTDGEKRQLTTLLGKLIEKLPGKSEEWLMLSVEDGTYMAFRGEDGEYCAMIEVDVFGKTDTSACDELTEALCDKVGELLGIRPDRIYVKYCGYEIWGYNRFNF